MKPLNKVITNKDTSFNPIWIMRQAGRYLPEFREIRKENPNFINLCLNPYRNKQSKTARIAHKIAAPSKPKLGTIQYNKHAYTKHSVRCKRPTTFEKPLA